MFRNFRQKLLMKNFKNSFQIQIGHLNFKSFIGCLEFITYQFKDYMQRFVFFKTK
jgi:hypothetical protein